MPNIYEVAKRAGVSTATVSRVLSRPQVVSPETRRRVLQAVKVMAYAPNSAAKNLRTLRTGKLLVTVPDISNPFFSLILQGIEDAAAAAEAMDHLYARGHRHVGIITGPLVSPLSRDRLHGATTRARAEGAEQDFIIMHGDFSIESGSIAAERLFLRQERPTAIFCFNDEMALGVLQVARRQGIRTPADRSIVGVADIRSSHHHDPPL